MRECRLLLENGTLGLWEWQGRQWREVHQFPDSPEGHAAFSHFFTVDREISCRFLVNLPDEQFSLEKIPRLPRRELRALLAERQHRGPPGFWSCLSVLRQPAQAHDFLCGHHVPQAALLPWLQPLAQENIPLLGLYSLSQCLPSALPAPIPPDSRILVSRHGNSHRLSLLLQGSIVDSRWLADGSFSEQALPPFIDLAIRKGWLAAPPALPPQVLEQAPEGGADTGPQPLSAWLIQRARRHWPQAQFAPAALRTPGQARLLGRQLQRTASVLTLLALLTGTGTFLAAQGAATARETTSETLQQAIRDLSTVQEAPDARGWTRPEYEALDTVLTRHRTEAGTLTRSLAAVAETLVEFPDIRLEGIDWDQRDRPARLRLLGRNDIARDAASDLERWRQQLSPRFKTGPLEQQDDGRFSLALEPRP